jgi:exodeoxyribonuclease VII large subunit
LQQRLGDLSSRNVGEKRRKFSALAASLDAMSPLKVLSRGYAVVRNEQGIVKGYRDAPAGSRIEVALGEGTLDCTVEKGRP